MSPVESIMYETNQARDPVDSASDMAAKSGAAVVHCTQLKSCEHEASQTGPGCTRAVMTAGQDFSCLGLHSH